MPKVIETKILSLSKREALVLYFLDNDGVRICLHTENEGAPSSIEHITLPPRALSWLAARLPGYKKTKREPKVKTP